MRPSSPSIVHRLRFTGFTESQFQGGGNDPIPTDIGLWVVGAGVLDLAGTPKTSWTRLRSSASRGASRLSLQTSVSGWRPGDELMIAPTEAPNGPSAYTNFDVRVIRSASGSSVSLRSGLVHPHPRVNTWGAEVANLSRNVRIEGQDATHRTHIFIRSSRRQTIRNVAIRYVGPRRDRDGDGAPEFVLGRYGIHFHRMANASRGSIVDGVVIRNAGSHAFVPHRSHGITFRNTVAFDTLEEPYWYDPEVFQSSELNPPVESPNNTVIDHALAALVRNHPRITKHRLSGFRLGAGTGNIMRNSTAVGVVGGIDSSGFIWPENRAGVWNFRNNLAHNNSRNGIFVWQNSPLPHVITRFTAYHNGYAGIEHGAYTNGYRYADSILYGNRTANIALHAKSRRSPSMGFLRMTLDGAGITQYGYLLLPPTTAVTGFPALVCGNRLSDHRGEAYHISYSGEDSNVEDRLDIRSSC